MIDATNLKLKAVEQQKVKLTQEVNIMIKEVEISQVTIKELHVKLTDREKRSEELAIKLREMTNLFEKADHDSKARAQEQGQDQSARPGPKGKTIALGQGQISRALAGARARLGPKGKAIA